MFSNSIDSKASKLKINLDTYLNNEKKKESSSAQPTMRRPDQMYSSNYPPTQLPQTLSSSVHNQPPKPNEIEVKQIIFQNQNRACDKGPMSLRNLAKQKAIIIIYPEEQTTFKLEIKVNENNFKIQVNQTRPVIELTCKRINKYKRYKQENGDPKWLMLNELSQEKLIITFNKDVKTIKNYFEPYLQFSEVKLEHVDPTVKIEDRMGEMPREEIIDSEDVINFTIPTQQQLLSQENQKLRDGIRGMKEEEKNNILMDIFKIKKEYQDFERKRLKCPIHSCQKQFREIVQLKGHLKKHPELIKHGIELTEFGVFEYSQKAMDLALYLGKMHPGEMKKIIRKMKTRQTDS